jgi:hypothetical protein
MKFAQIVFMQDEEAREVGEMMNDNGIEAVVEYLAQWDNGEYGDVRDESTAGMGWQENVHRSGDYVLTWNPYIGYFGLQRLVEDDYSPLPV